MRNVAVQQVLLSTSSGSIAVASTAIVYTKAFDLSKADYFSVAYKALSSAGSPDVKIQLEESVNGNPPATEGSSDTNFVIPENMADIESSLATELFKIKSLNPVTSKWGRFKITGNASNAADTILTMYLFMQEEL